MSEQAASKREAFRTVLRDQQRRVVDALAADEAITATPIIQEDETLSSEEYVTLVYELHHVQLPELASAGVIEFNRREGIVSRGARFDDTRHLVAHDENR